MSILLVVLTILLALISALSAREMLRRNPLIEKSLTTVRVPLSWIPFLASAKIAGAVGLFAGIAFNPLRIAAAVGLSAYFAGAVIAHLRVRDRDVTAAAVIGALAVTVTVLSIAQV